MFTPMHFLVYTVTLLIVLIYWPIGINCSCGKCHNHQHKHKLCQTTSTTPSVPAMECQAPIDPGTGKQASMSLLIRALAEQPYSDANYESPNPNFDRTMNSLGACFCEPPTDTENSKLMQLKYFFSSSDNASKYIDASTCDKFCVLSEDGHIYSSPIWSDLYRTSDSEKDIIANSNTSTTLIQTTTPQVYDVGQGAVAIIYPHCVEKNQDCHVYMSFIQLYRKCVERNVCHAGETDPPAFIISGTLKMEDGSFWTSPKLPSDITLDNVANIAYDSRYLRIVAIGCDATCDMIGKQTCDGSFVSMTECQAPSLHDGQKLIPLISEDLFITSSSLLGVFACSNWIDAKFYTNWLRPNYTGSQETDILVQCGSDFKNFCALTDDGKFYQLASNYNNNTTNKLSVQLFPRCDEINEGCKTHLSGTIDMYNSTFPFDLVNQVPLSLKDVNGSIWTSPPEETPVVANAGYLPVIAYSCLGCEAIRNLRCKTAIKTSPHCDEEGIICRLKACLPSN